MATHHFPIGTTTTGELKLDLPRLIETRLLVQSNSGGGKSWLLRRLLEQTAGHVQQIVLDVEGEFSTLREKHDFIICAPKGADAVAHPRTAALLARRLLETGVSAICDIYDLKAHERTAFVKLFLESLLNAPKDLWHPVLIVIDEAHMFAPEKGHAESLGAVIDLATRGRKRGMCAVLATQRLSKLHKDAAAELLNKLIGRTGLDVDVKRAADEIGMGAKEAMPILRELEPGEFFAFGPALSRSVTRLKVGPVETRHPKVGERLLAAPPIASEKIKKVLAELSDLPKEAEQEVKTLAELKSENASLKRELTLAKKAAPVTKEKSEIDKKEIIANRIQYAKLKKLAEELMKFIVKITADETLIKSGLDVDAMEKAARKAVDEIRKQVDARFDSQRRLIETYRRQGANLFKQMESFLSDANVPIEVNLSKQEPIKAEIIRSPEKIESANGKVHDGLSGPMQRILDAIAWFEGIGIMEPEQVAVAFLAGYTVGGGAFNNPRGALRTAGMIEYRNERLALTDLGRQCANPPDNILTTEELHRRVLERLPGPERKLLQVLLEVHPDDIAEEELAERTGYSAGGGAFNNPRGRLRSLGLVIYPAPKRVRAADILFPQGMN